MKTVELEDIAIAAFLTSGRDYLQEERFISAYSLRGHKLIMVTKAFWVEL